MSGSRIYSILKTRWYHEDFAFYEHHCLLAFHDIASSDTLSMASGNPFIIDPNTPTAVLTRIREEMRAIQQAASSEPTEASDHSSTQEEPVSSTSSSTLASSNLRPHTTVGAKSSSRSTKTGPSIVVATNPVLRNIDRSDRSSHQKSPSPPVRTLHLQGYYLQPGDPHYEHARRVTGDQYPYWFRDNGFGYDSEVVNENGDAE